MSLDESLARIDVPTLNRDLGAVCDFGGRLSGTEGERAAVAFLKKRLRRIADANLTSFSVPYAGWESSGATLDLGDGRLDVQPLVGSPPTSTEGLIAEIIDLGRGAGADFDTAAARIAAGFVVANPWADSGKVAGGLGFGDPATIPAVGVSQALAEQLHRMSASDSEVRMSVASRSSEQHAESLVLDMPGRNPEWVVVSAHLDGHSVAESAIDNASGVVAAIAVAEALAPIATTLKRGVRICLFNIEEWGLLASRSYVAGLSEFEQGSIALDVNLDSVAGAEDIAVMVSGFAGLTDLVAQASQSAGIAADVHLPLVRNSDHYNFAEVGIPAVRVVAGFGDSDASLRYVLTEADTRDLVATGELVGASRFATAMTYLAAQASAQEVAKWRTIE